MPRVHWTHDDRSWALITAMIEHENEMLTIAEHLAHVYVDVLGEPIEAGSCTYRAGSQCMID